MQLVCVCLEILGTTGSEGKLLTGDVFLLLQHSWILIEMMFFFPPGRPSLSALLLANKHPDETFPFIAVELSFLVVLCPTLYFLLWSAGIRNSAWNGKRWDIFDFLYLRREGWPFFPPCSSAVVLFCFVSSSYFFSINSKSHHPLSSLVEIHWEIQKYLQDTDWCANKAVKTA